MLKQTQLNKLNNFSCIQFSEMSVRGARFPADSMVLERCDDFTAAHWKIKHFMLVNRHWFHFDFFHQASIELNGFLWLCARSLARVSLCVSAVRELIRSESRWKRCVNPITYSKSKMWLNGIYSGAAGAQSSDMPCSWSVRAMYAMHNLCDNRGKCGSKKSVFVQLNDVESTW